MEWDAEWIRGGWATRTCPMLRRDFRLDKEVVSAVHYAESGQLKDGSYSAIFSFILKLGSAVGLLITGWLVDWAGIVSQADVQTLDAINRIAAATFVSGPAVMILAALVVSRYPLTRAFMKEIDSRNREKDQ